MTRRPGPLAGLVALALLLRVGAIAATHAWDAHAEENRQIARNLRHGRGFTFTQFGVTGPTAVRGPAYPILLAVLGPDNVKLILAVNVLAGAAAVVGAYALLRRLAPSPGYGPWIAAAAFAVWPTQVYAATLTQGLSLAVAGLLMSLTLALRRTPPATIVAGLIGGLTALTEPILAIPLLLAAPLVSGSLSREDTGEGTRAAAFGRLGLYLVAGLVLVAPWLYRNAIVFGGPTPITSNFWPDAFLGNGPQANGERYDSAAERDPEGNLRLVTRIERLEPQKYDQMKRPEAQRVAVLRNWTKEWIAAHSGMYLNLCIWRVFETNFAPGGHPLAEKWAYLASRGVGAAAFLILPWAVWRGPGDGSVAAALLVGICLTTAFSLAEARNSVFVDVPQLILWAAALGDRRPAKAAA